MKKFITAILVLALVLALVPATVFAAEGDIANVDDLRAALTGAGGSYQLTADITTDGVSITIPAGRVISLDLNGHRITQKENHTTGNAYVLNVLGTLTLNDGTSTDGAGIYGISYCPVKINGGTVTVNDGVTLFGKVYGAVVITGATFTLNDGTVEAGAGDGVEAYGISGIGNSGQGNITININGGVVKGGTAANNAGIYMPNTGNINVTRGYIEGGTAISMKSGTLNMTGGTVVATGVATDPATANSNGVEMTGAAISVTTNAAYAGSTSVNITNATLISENGVTVYEGIAVKADQDPAAAAPSVNRLTVANSTLYSGIGETSYIAHSEEVAAANTASTGTATVLANTAVTVEDYPVTPDMPEQNAQTEVTASSDPTYTIIIPEAVNFGKLNRSMPVQDKPFTVTIENALFENNMGVNVTVNGDGFAMKLEGAPDVTLSYVLSNTAQVDDDDSFVKFVAVGVTESANVKAVADLAGDTPDAGYTATIEGTIKTDPSKLTRAGNYSGTMVFTCTYE